MASPARARCRTGRVSRRDSHAASAFTAAVVLALSGLASAAAAQSQVQLEPFQVRASLGVATMVSDDQVNRLGYDAFGILFGAQLGYALLPWLEPQLGVAAGGFPSTGRAGGLLSPTAGVLVGTLGHAIRPYAQVDVGPGFTGPITRPFFRAGIGVDFRISSAFVLGPVLGYGHLVQPNIPGNSTDARFFSLGASLLFRPAVSRLEQRPRRVVLYEHVRAPIPAEAPIPPAEPSVELRVLMDEVLPKAQVELLAPVLFKFDSDELEPIGVAMLHEVSRELARRSDIELVEIQGYADSRGRTEYNDALSARRAQRVLEWLVEHGVDRARLQAAARGASGFVEAGENEQNHEQNRRVVFRVVRMREP